MCEEAYAKGFTDCKKEFRTCKAGENRAGRATCKGIRDNVCEPNAKQSNDANFKVYVECAKPRTSCSTATARAAAANQRLCCRSNRAPSINALGVAHAAAALGVAVAAAALGVAHAAAFVLADPAAAAAARG